MKAKNIYHTFCICLFFLYFIAASLCFCTVPTSIYAETGYVSDMLVLSLRDGPGRQYNTIKTLRSNTEVEIIETSDSERFLKVKTKEGEVGWVENQYITHELPKALIIEQLKEKIAQLEADNPDFDKVGQQNEAKIAEDGNALNRIDLTTNKAAEYINKIKSLEAQLKNQIEKNKLIETKLGKIQSGNKLNSLDINSKDKSSYNGSINNIIVQNNDTSNIHENIPDNITEEDIHENDKIEEQDEDSLFFAGKTNIILPDDDILKTAMIKWFCAGAGVLIAGWFIGRSFAGTKRRRGLLD